MSSTEQQGRVSETPYHMQLKKDNEPMRLESRAKCDFTQLVGQCHHISDGDTNLVGQCHHISDGDTNLVGQCHHISDGVTHPPYLCAM